MPKLSKIEAARRQLDCAIRLYFDNEDLLAVHSLSRAAFRLLYDLQPANNLREAVTLLIHQFGWDSFNKLTNFLKHADRDPDAEVDEASEADIQIGIAAAATLYRHMAKQSTPEMEAFQVWMKVMDEQADARKSDWEFEEDYPDAEKPNPAKRAWTAGKRCSR